MKASEHIKGKSKATQQEEEDGDIACMDTIWALFRYCWTFCIGLKLGRIFLCGFDIEVRTEFLRFGHSYCILHTLGLVWLRLRAFSLSS